MVVAVGVPEGVTRYAILELPNPAVLWVWIVSLALVALSLMVTVLGGTNGPAPTTMSMV